MLTNEKLQHVLEKLPQLSVAVVGDFFLDKYLDIDGRLTETSLETGLDAYQVVAVRTSPGAGGTVTNNLSALGVGRIAALTVIGADGEGFELQRELASRRVQLANVIEAADRRTPTYTKPMLGDRAGLVCELNRFDIKNREPLPNATARQIVRTLDDIVAAYDAVIIADQVSEPECGVVTCAVRERLAELADRHSDKLIVADSRERIGLYRNVITKPNRAECLKAVGFDSNVTTSEIVCDAAKQLSRRTDRKVFCTLGENGILIADGNHTARVTAFPVGGPLDIVGAGDSTTAGIVCGLCGGLDPSDAAALGNLIASITIQQIGTTGTATPEQVLARWRQVQTTSGT